MTDFRARQLQVGKYRHTSFITLYCTSQVLHFFYKLNARPSTSKKVTTRFKETVSRFSALEPNLQRLRVGPVLLCSDALKALPGLAVSDFSPPGLSYSSIPVKLLIPLPHSSAFSFLSFLSRKQPFSQLITPLLLKHFVP